MVSTHSAPLRAMLACALAGVCALAAAQDLPAQPPANVADPQAAVPAVRYRPAFTYRAEATPVITPAPAPDMAMHGMHMAPSPAAATPAPALHQHHAGMPMPAMSMPMPKPEDK